MVEWACDVHVLEKDSEDVIVQMLILGCTMYSSRTGVGQDDVNAVVFADESCHLIYSGSDDHICKVLRKVTRPSCILSF